MMDVKRERHKEVNLLCMYLQFWWKYIQKMAMQIGKYYCFGEEIALYKIHHFLRH